MYDEIIEKKTFQTIDDALKQLKAVKLNFVKNNKGISCFESADVYQSTADGLKRYYKEIDPSSGLYKNNIDV